MREKERELEKKTINRNVLGKERRGRGREKKKGIFKIFIEKKEERSNANELEKREREKEWYGRIKLKIRK